MPDRIAPIRQTVAGNTMLLLLLLLLLLPFLLFFLLFLLLLLLLPLLLVLSVDRCYRPPPR
jgi:hypothetical protein